jgi:hypothetical protein
MCIYHHNQFKTMGKRLGSEYYEARVKEYKDRQEKKLLSESMKVSVFTFPDPSAPQEKKEEKKCNYIYNYGVKTGTVCGEPVKEGKKKCSRHLKKRQKVAPPLALPPSVSSLPAGWFSIPPKI